MTANRHVARLYRRFRAAGYTAAESYRSACTVYQFRNVEFNGSMPKDGDLRIIAEPAQENYFDVYGEPEGYTNIYGRRVTAEQERQEIVDSIERNGLWTVCCEMWDGDDWEVVDSVGMNCGYNDPTDPVENCYVPDLMVAGMTARLELIGTDTLAAATL